MAKVLAPHAELLASAGLGEDVIADLTADGEYLAAASARLDDARQRRSRATAAIRQEIEKAMQMVTVIEGILMARPEQDHRAAMAEWRGARRVYERLGRPPERRTRPPASPPS
jgi:hypothetical protein